MSKRLEELCRKYEHYETDNWSPTVILQHEVCTRRVVDPCVGTGILAEAAKDAGYEVFTNDIRHWGYEHTDHLYDFLSEKAEHHLAGLIKDQTVFVNPPFSKAVDFVERALELGARKVICYQRFAWRECSKRREFWEKNPPCRIYLCGDRATSWRHDIPKDQREGWVNPKTGKRRAGTPTAHAWFIWERGQPGAGLLSAIWKPRDKENCVSHSNQNKKESLK